LRRRPRFFQDVPLLSQRGVLLPQVLEFAPLLHAESPGKTRLKLVMDSASENALVDAEVTSGLGPAETLVENKLDGFGLELWGVLPALR
jgi:hypothetical protein